MRFCATEQNEVIDVMRFLSEEGVWEFGIRRVIFGWRVALSQIGDCCYTLDYCAGGDFGFAMVLLATIAKILESYPESVRIRQIQDAFPRYERRPINLDPCWTKLHEMAWECEPPSLVEAGDG